MKYSVKIIEKTDIKTVVTIWPYLVRTPCDITVEMGGPAWDITFFNSEKIKDEAEAHKLFDLIYFLYLRLTNDSEEGSSMTIEFGRVK